MTDDWLDRVWAALAKDCREPDCRQDLKLICWTGWPYQGVCTQCDRTWLVHRDKIVRQHTRV